MWILIALMLVAAVCLAFAFGWHLFLSTRFKGEPPVLWSWCPILGHAMAMGSGSGVLGLLRTCCHHLNEDVVGILTAGKRLFFITDPASFDVIFKADPSKISFDEFTLLVRKNIFGESMASIETTKPMEAVMHSFYSKYLLNESACNKLTHDMQVILGELVEHVKPGEYNMFKFVFNLVLKASSAALFDESFLSDEFVDLFMQFDENFALGAAGVPFSLLPNGNSRVIIKKMIAFSKPNSELISQRRALFTSLGLAEDDMASLQLGMLWAASGNTGPGTFWVLYYVLSHNEALTAVMQELRQVLPEEVRTSQNPLYISTDQLSQLRILDSCISEALRLASGSLIMRKVLVPCSVTLKSGRTYKLRKGDLLGIAPPLVHRAAEYYPDPDSFKYDRFLTPTGSNTLKTFLPFGAGASYCPGRKFAAAEIKCICAYLLTKYTMRIVGGGVEAQASCDQSRVGVGVFLPTKPGPQLELKLRSE